MIRDTAKNVRLLLDWRNSQYGKWRPSRQATRLGRHAITLERLMSRDSLSAAEAVEYGLIDRVIAHPTEA